MPVSRYAGKGWEAWLCVCVSAWWGWMRRGVEEDCGARVWWVGCENSMRRDVQVMQHAFNLQRMCLIAGLQHQSHSHTSKAGFAWSVPHPPLGALTLLLSPPPCLPLTPPSSSQAAAADKGNAELASAAKAEVDKLLGLKKQLAAAEEA